jgi:hypothetical protein
MMSLNLLPTVFWCKTKSFQCESTKMADFVASLLLWQGREHCTRSPCYRGQWMWYSINAQAKEKKKTTRDIVEE